MRHRLNTTCFRFPGKWVSLYHSAGRKLRLGRETACGEAEGPRVSPPGPGAPALEAAAWHWPADRVFGVWGYQNPQLISAEATIPRGWVRTFDLAPCSSPRSHVGLFTHLAEVWRSGKLARPQS